MNYYDALVIEYGKDYRHMKCGMRCLLLQASWLLLLPLVASATSTVWLKDRSGNVCTNTASNNPSKIIGYGGHDINGNFILTIDNPESGVVAPAGTTCSNIPRTHTATTPGVVVFNGPATIIRSVKINMVKPGTGGQPECLNQGLNVSGVHNWLAPLIAGAYTLRLSFSYSNGCDPATGLSLTPDGLPVFERGARIDGGPRTFNGNYYIKNINSVPEPGSLLLIVVGVIPLICVAQLRKKRLV